MAITQTRGRAAAAPPPPQLVSCSIDNFSTGLIDDIDVEITDAQTCEWDYNGTQPPGPALCLELTDVNGQQHVQYWSAGKADDWSPSEDGRGFIAVSGKTKISNSSNLFHLVESLVNNDVPNDLFAAGDFKALIGLKGHVEQKTLERKGLIRTGKNADRPSQVLVFTKVDSLPGAEPPAKTTTGKAAARPAAGKQAQAAPAQTKAAAGGRANGAAAQAPATQAAAQAGGDDVDAEIAEALVAALAERGDSIPKKEIGKIVFAAFSGGDAKVRNHAVARSNDAAFLKSKPLTDQGVVFDGTAIAMAE